MIDELLINLRERLSERSSEPQELSDALNNLETAIAHEHQRLKISERKYQELVEHQGEVRRKLQNGIERRAEINNLKARFTLLDKHYQSDLSRLAGIREAGSLVAALSGHICPLCGADPRDQHQEADCDGNMEVLISASDAESSKILLLRKELEDTVTQLEREVDGFERLMPSLREELDKLEESIKVLGPGLTERRIFYTDLIDNRATIRDELSVLNQLRDLKARRDVLEILPEAEGGQSQPVTDFSTSTLDEFAQQVERVLRAWNLPDSERVQFEQTARDLIINGSRRGNHGKGIRSITHAGFTIGLLEYCLKKRLPHPGFVILDSPLLAYREPDGEEDNLSGTDVQDRFYEYLAKSENGQVLIIENEDPPEVIRAQSGSQFFSKNTKQGRYGLFPAS